jgi:hypothetical protein
VSVAEDHPHADIPEGIDDVHPLVRHRADVHV